MGLPRGGPVDAVYNYLWSGAGEASWLRGLYCAFVDLIVRREIGPPDQYSQGTQNHLRRLPTHRSPL